MPVAPVSVFQEMRTPADLLVIHKMNFLGLGWPLEMLARRIPRRLVERMTSSRQSTSCNGLGASQSMARAEMRTDAYRGLSQHRQEAEPRRFTSNWEESLVDTHEATSQQDVVVMHLTPQ